MVGQQCFELALAQGLQNQGLGQLCDADAIHASLKQRAEIIADEAAGQLQHLHTARAIAAGLHKKGRALFAPSDLQLQQRVRWQIAQCGRRAAPRQVRGGCA